MAPTTTPNNSAKSLQQNRLRPAVPKQTVPAVPLTFGQRRQKQQAVRTKPQEEVAASAPPAVLNEPSPPPTPQHQPDIDKKVEINGTPKNHITENTEGTNESAASWTPATPATETDGTDSVLAATEASVHEPSKEPEAQESVRSAPSETMSSESRSTYHMPPPFVPANANHVPTMSSETVKFPPQPIFNGQSPMHHAHPSAGSVMFGGYPESNNSSPAPPQSAGNVPPYPYPQQPRHVGGRHGAHLSNGGHSHHLSNGFSPLGPPPPGYYLYPDANINSGPESYPRRYVPSFAPPDGYTPSSTPFGMEGQRLNAYDSPTPYQGSQSSAPSEHENGQAFYGPGPTAVISNGNNGHIDDVHLYHPQRPAPLGPIQNNPPPQVHVPMPMDNLDGLVNYVQRQFSAPEFTDCLVQLRFTDGRGDPPPLPRHGMVLARSPFLKGLMSESSRDEHGICRLLIESNDRFLQVDAFWAALYRLYGGPLLDMEAAPINTPVQIPHSLEDRLGLALGYAAAGHTLQIPPVVTRGIEIACTLIQWTTIEKALDFALDGGLDAQWILESSHQQPKSPSTYGPTVNMLIRYALDYVVSSFPPDFELDRTVDDSTFNRRLPAVPKQRQSISDKFRNLHFGDHDNDKSTNNDRIITLSKVLLNLPFHLLKYVLESHRLGNVERWATLNLRRTVVKNVVEEREKRRMEVYNHANVSNADRQNHSTKWQAVGWQEFVEEHTEGIPVLARRWVDYVLPAQQE
ncbi:hypothetical protein LSUE1_G008018 [Lachnellula suecica]|uniref:Uncharacterized protein n=1 Tax=Lachnellula suecica TaxID=602035 RepID=A0A8T9C1Y4_9HELO|nr:hypothetical protein LSUE1_G008018 [Lachnellula suecica]